jgi:hypothetical protein
MSKQKTTTKDYFVESGIKEIRLLRKHFHIVGDGDDVQVEREITPADVINFYTEYFARIRPSNLGSEKILPFPNRNKLRALYMGDVDANILLNTIIRHVLYVDQILIVDPFLTLILSKDHPKSVLNRPELWVSAIINRALCLCAIEEWVEQSIILLIPNVFYYHPEMLQRPQNYRTTPELQREFEHRMIRDLLLSESPENRDAMLDLFVSMGRKMSETERTDLLNEVKQYERENPIRFRLDTAFFDKHFSSSQTRSEIFATSNGGLPLFHASEIAQKTGSFLVFDYQYLYEMLCINFSQVDSKTDSFQQLSLAFQNLDFPFLHNVPSKKALELRNQGYLLSFRIYLRELWQTIIATENPQLLDDKIFDFRDRLTSEYSQLEKEWQQIRKDLLVSATVTGTISGLTVIAPGSISLGFAVAAAGGFGLSGYQAIKDLRQVNQNPLAVFLKLSH